MSIITEAWRRLAAFARHHRAALGQSVRVTVSAVLTLVVGQWLNIPLVLWSVLTAVVVTQVSVGRSLKATIDYLIGTLGGALYAGAVAVLIPHESEIALLGVLALAVAPVAFVAVLSSSFNVAPFTAIIVVLAPGLTHSTPIESAFYRVIEVGLGALIGLMVSFAVFPARAHAHATEQAARLLELIASALPDLFRGFTEGLDPEEHLRIQGRIGHAVARLDAIHTEAKRERMTHLASEPDPGPLMRTLVRLRHDLVIVGRAAGVPLPEHLRPRLGPPLARLVETLADYLRRCAAALLDKAGPPPPTSIEAAFGLYAGEIEALRREGLLRVLPSDDLERIFALGFAIEQMRQHLKDLERCVMESARLPLLPNAPAADDASLAPK